MRTNFDFTPYRRSTVGFDRLFDTLEASIRGDVADGYPPFDLERRGADGYRITIALAGFRPDEIEVVAQRGQLAVSGKPADDKVSQYLHRGIAARPFEQRFQLADFVEVSSATFSNGLLTIDLQRVVPEAMKPQKIEIGGGSPNERFGASPGEAPQDAGLRNDERQAA